MLVNIFLSLVFHQENEDDYLALKINLPSFVKVLNYKIVNHYNVVYI